MYTYIFIPGFCDWRIEEVILRERSGSFKEKKRKRSMVKSILGWAIPKSNETIVEYGAIPALFINSRPDNGNKMQHF